MTQTKQPPENPGAVHNEQTKEYASKAAGFENIASMVGLQLAYDNYYRALTTDSAHVNVWALMSHFNAEHVGLNIGPGVGDYPDTLNIAIVLGGYMLEVANFALKQDAITALYKRVVDAVVELMLPPILPA